MSMRTATVGVAVLIFVLGGAAGLAWFVLGGDPSADTVDPLQGHGAGNVDGPVRGGAGGESLTQPARDRGPPPAEAPADGKPWIVVPGFEEALDAIDWAETGAAMGRLVPMLADAAVAAERGDIIPDSVIRATTVDHEIVLNAARSGASVFTSSQPSGVVTHPAFAANLAASALHARRGGVSVEQLAALSALTDSAVAAERDAAEAAGETDETPRVITAADEHDRRHPFYESLDKLLTERQRMLLHSDQTRGRVRMDPLSAAPVFDDITRPVLYTDDESLKHLLGMELLSGMGFGGEREGPALDLIVARSREMLGGRARKRTPWLDAMGHMRGTETSRWARWNAKLMTDLIIQASGGRMTSVPPDVVNVIAIPLMDPGGE